MLSRHDSFTQYLIYKSNKRLEEEMGVLANGRPLQISWLTLCTGFDPE